MCIVDKALDNPSLSIKIGSQAGLRPCSQHLPLLDHKRKTRTLSPALAQNSLGPTVLGQDIYFVPCFALKGAACCFVICVDVSNSLNKALRTWNPRF